MTRYVAFLRGVNVGGKSLLKMEDLKATLIAEGWKHVSTYIQSGNVFFSHAGTDQQAIARKLTAVIKQHFHMEVEAVVFSAADWQKVMAAAPNWWGDREGWKHNLLILIPPTTPEEAITAIGELKPDIEAVQAGPRVVFQSMFFQKFGQTTTGKLASNAVYKKMTVRNANTSRKIAHLLEV